jgi:hypothetical protein
VDMHAGACIVEATFRACETVHNTAMYVGLILGM